MLTFGKVRVHEKDDTPITSTLSAVQEQTLCILNLMHYDSEPCLCFYPASEFPALMCQFKEKQKVLNEDYYPAHKCFCSVLKDENLYQRARKITSSVSFVLMRTKSVVWCQEYWSLKGIYSPQIRFYFDTAYSWIRVTGKNSISFGLSSVSSFGLQTQYTESMLFSVLNEYWRKVVARNLIGLPESICPSSDIKVSNKLFPVPLYI